MVILKRYQDNQLSASSLSLHQSLEAALDQLISTKYSIYFILKYCFNLKIFFLGQVVAGNTDGFVEATINEFERIYSQNAT